MDVALLVSSPEVTSAQPKCSKILFSNKNSWKKHSSTMPNMMSGPGIVHPFSRRIKWTKRIEKLSKRMIKWTDIWMVGGNSKEKR
jgi:hypothetical protein